MIDYVAWLSAATSAAGAATLTRWWERKRAEHREAARVAEIERRARDDFEAWRRVARAREAVAEQRIRTLTSIVGGSLTPADRAEARTASTPRQDAARLRIVGRYDARELQMIVDRIAGGCRPDAVVIADAQGLARTREGVLERRLARLAAAASDHRALGATPLGISLRTASLLSIELRPLPREPSLWLVVAQRGQAAFAAAMDGALALASAIAGEALADGGSSDISGATLRGHRHVSGHPGVAAAISEWGAALGVTAAQTSGLAVDASYSMDGPPSDAMAGCARWLARWSALSSVALGESVDRCLVRTATSVCGRIEIDDQGAALAFVADRPPTDADVMRLRGMLRRTGALSQATEAA